MRINAHFASAILPNDICAKMPMLLNMAKRHTNLEVIKSQQEEIKLICTINKISTSGLAKQAGVVASTINRFMQSETPANTLSSVTMAKIRNAFSSHIEKQAPKDFTETEVGLMSAIRAVIIILSNYDVIRQNDLKNVFSYQQKDFRMRAQPGAAAVMQQLIEFLNDSPPVEIVENTRRPLSPAQDQSKNAKSLES